jgi:hypothetical protein
MRRRVHRAGTVKIPQNNRPAMRSLTVKITVLRGASTVISPLRDRWRRAYLSVPIRSSGQ